MHGLLFAEAYLRENLLDREGLVRAVVQHSTAHSIHGGDYRAFLLGAVDGHRHYLELEERLR